MFFFSALRQPKTAQEAPKTPQDSSKRTPRGPQDAKIVPLLRETYMLCIFAFLV